MMRHEKTLLYVSGIIMDFSWLYAWATFSMIPLGGRGFPIAYLFILFICAMIVAHVIHGKGLRIATIGIAEASGILAALFWTTYLVSGSHRAILDHLWLVEFFATHHSAIEWLRFIITAFWTVAIWLGGTFFALRPLTHEKISARFDIGLAAFLCLVLIKFALEMKGGLSVPGDLTVTFACIFFFFGLLAIGITRAHGPGATSLIYGRRKIGIVLGFISAVFLSVISLVVFLRQPLAQAAEVGYTILTKAGSSIGSLFVKFIKFLYLPRQVKIKEPPSGGQDSMFNHISSSGSGPWVEAAGRILAWLVGTFMGIMVLIMIVVGAIWIIRWLLTRTAKENRSNRQSFRIPVIWKRFRIVITGLLRYFKRYRTAADFYQALRAWSRRSGIRQVISETPSEFSDRITTIFPVIGPEIESITHAFNREFYGDIRLKRNEIASVRSNWRKLASPKLWPDRIKTIVRGR